jgi:rRNA-processing protein FCF1
VRRELDAAVRECSRLREEASRAKADSLRSARALLDVETRLAIANARIAELEELADDRGRESTALSSRLERAERVSGAMQGSLSWQLTAPLRALKRRI